MSHVVFISTLFMPPQTEKGSALHEAALFGKTDVVQKLLNAGQTSVPHEQCFNPRKNPGLTVVCRSPGIDVNIVDQKGLRALDTTKDMPSQKSREIAALILGGEQTTYWSGKCPLDFTFTNGDTISCVSAVGHMTGKPPDIDLPPPPVPPPQESPSPRKKGKI